MKNRIIALLLTLVMLVGMVGVFASCGEEEPEAQEPCTTHTDKNGDTSSKADQDRTYDFHFAVASC